MISRREFVLSTAVGGLVAATPAAAPAEAVRRPKVCPNEQVVLGFMGVNGRGTDLARSFSAISEVRIAAICDVDDKAIAKAMAAVGTKQSQPLKAVKDFRAMLDDKEIDAIVIAAPDHWHAPATILACAAGKHVYCEKPASHNPREGELMVAAARKHNRVVQIGTQRRSMPGVMEGIAAARSREIGRTLFARGWYNNTRPSIGHGKAAAPPAGLDYALWQGPAPEREFRDNILHYNWHWFWNWGTGELGNNGIHALDVCRWGMGVDCPNRVTAGGGKYRHDDDQETPDTMVVTYEFDGKAITWEGRSWHPRGFEGSQFGIAFYGEGGTIVIDEGGFEVLDIKGKQARKVTGSSSETPHLRNFLECVRSGARPNADVEEGVKSTLLCHLGNIAWRTGRTVNLDPSTHRITGDAQAAGLWKRQYRPGWEPKV